MKLDKSLFDSADPEAEAEADARADADAKAGRVISHGAVRRWLSSWGAQSPVPRPRSGD
jgi:predicted transcriptional regulator